MLHTATVDGDKTPCLSGFSSLNYLNNLPIVYLQKCQINAFKPSHKISSLVTKTLFNATVRIINTRILSLLTTEWTSTRGSTRTASFPARVSPFTPTPPLSGTFSLPKLPKHVSVALDNLLYPSDVSQTSQGVGEGTG